jgi:hypothetical protein
MQEDLNIFCLTFIIYRVLNQKLPGSLQKINRNNVADKVLLKLKSLLRMAAVMNPRVCSGFMSI